MSETDGFRILAICSGNVCRSPLVELLLRQGLADRPDFAIEGAGTIARPGDRMTEEMIAVAGRYGVAEDEARSHEARRLDEAAVDRADLILGLTREHRAKAVEMQPSAVKRAFTLTEFARLLEGVAAREADLAAGELVAGVSARRGLDRMHSYARDDIDDPIGLPQAVYDRVGDEMATAVAVIVDELRNTRAGTTARRTAHPSPGGPSLAFSFRPA